MCGATNFKATKEHVLPRGWKTHFPWINSERVRAVRRSETDEMSRDVPLQYLEQSVAPFCGDCNHRFMREFDQAALPVFQRLATSSTASILPHEIEILRSWAYKTMLVRTLLDEKAGLRAPERWFREFRQSDGVVPSGVVQFVGFLDYPTSALGNTVVGIESASGEAIRVHETMITFDRLTIITITIDGDATHDYLAVLDGYAEKFASVLVRLEGDEEIGPDALLPVRWLDAVRSPTVAIGLRGESFDPFPYFVPDVPRDSPPPA